MKYLKRYLGSYNSCIFNFIKNCQTHFPKTLYYFVFPVLAAPNPNQYFVFAIVFPFSHSNKCVASHFGFCFIFGKKSSANIESYVDIRFFFLHFKDVDLEIILGKIEE